MVWIQLGSLFMFLAVAFGAFAAHALKTRLAADLIGVFEVGVRYQAYHALGLFVVAWLSDRNGGAAINAAGWAFTIGIVVFSGSLYALAVTGVRWLGAITPLGGLAFLVGWLLVGWAALKA